MHPASVGARERAGRGTACGRDVPDGARLVRRWLGRWQRQVVRLPQHHHHTAGACLIYYVQRAWREGHRRTDNGGQVRGVVGLAMKAQASVDFCGCWQRAN